MKAPPLTIPLDGSKELTMNYWLMKSEPSTYSIDDLKQDKVTQWEGVRNYQARNFMRDRMKVGDSVLFYHSNAKPPGIIGLASVVKEAYPDYFAWDTQSNYFDPKASTKNPIWQMVDIQFKQKFSTLISLDQLKQHTHLEGLLVTKKGSRLSVQPVEEKHYQYIVETLAKV